MPLVHYGSELQIRLDVEATRHVMEAVSGYATRGGWVTATDIDARDWSFLVTPGVALWISDTN
jgi:hypothetical protein